MVAVCGYYYIMNSLHSVNGVSLLRMLAADEVEDEIGGLTVNCLLTIVLKDSGVEAELDDDA